MNVFYWIISSHMTLDNYYCIINMSLRLVENPIVYIDNPYFVWTVWQYYCHPLMPMDPHWMASSHRVSQGFPTIKLENWQTKQMLLTLRWQLNPQQHVYITIYLARIRKLNLYSYSAENLSSLLLRFYADARGKRESRFCLIGTHNCSAVVFFYSVWLFIKHG